MADWAAKRPLQRGDHVLSVFHVHYVFWATERRFVMACEAAPVRFEDYRRPNGVGLQVTDRPVNCLLCITRGES